MLQKTNPRFMTMACHTLVILFFSIATNLVSNAQGPDSRLYTWNGTGWDNSVPGAGARIAVDDQGNPWIVNAANQIYRYEGNRFIQLPGLGRDIAIGGGKVWVIGTDPVGNGSDFGIYKWNGSGWDKAPGGGTSIAVDQSGFPWITNSAKEIYQFDSDTHFIKQPGQGNDIAIGGGKVWIIGNNPVGTGSDYGVYRWNGTGWENVAGGGVIIAVDGSGNPWIANSVGAIYQYVNGGFALRPGRANDICIGGGRVFVIGREIKFVAENGLTTDYRIGRADIRPQNRGTLVTGGPLLTLKPNRVPEGLKAYSKSKFKMLPEIEIASDQSGNRVESSIAFTTKKPLEYDYGTRVFTGSVGFMLLGQTDVNQTTRINRTTSIEISSQAAKSLDPSKLRISHVGFPSQEVVVTSATPKDSIEITVFTENKPTGYRSYVKVNPALEIVSEHKSFQGFGVQKIPITVRLLGSGKPGRVTISFNSSKGLVIGSMAGKETNNTLDLEYGTPGTVYFRSEGLGLASVSAFGADVQSNALPITFDFPWMFLIASLAGGLIGSLAKNYVGEQKSEFGLRPFLGGALVGVIVVLAWYGLGLKLIGLDFKAEFNEIAVFTLSGVGAYFGIKKDDPKTNNATPQP